MAGFTGCGTRRLTFGGAVRERWVVTRRKRWNAAGARGALLALLD
jgi:hypothetical protein